MSTMHFMPTLQEYLLKNSSIYTIRKYRYSEDSEAIFIPGVGGCHRELVKEGVVKDDLVPYYSSSGFGTVEDWWNMVTKINPSLPRLYLYYVRVVRRLK